MVTKYTYRILFVFFIVAGLIYFPSFSYDFVNWDDYEYVVNNPLLGSLSFSNLGNIFQSFVVGNYHPLTTFSLAVNYHFHGLNPWGYHVVNLFFHLMNAFLVMLLALRLLNHQTAAFVVAVLFLLHPLKIESVVWVTERKDVLFAFFYILSLLSYMRYVDSHRRISSLRIQSLILFICSLLSKQAAISLPLILCLFDYYREGRCSRWKEKFPYFVLSFLFGVIALWGASTDLIHADGLVYSLPWMDRLLLSLSSLAFYVTKFFFPLHLSCFYPLPSYSVGSFWKAYGVSFILLITFVCAFYNLLKDKRNLSLGLFFFLFTVLFNLPLLSVGHVMAADRFMYLPSIGVSFLVAIAVTRFKSARTLFCFWFVWLVVLTWQRLPVWKNSETLWSDVLRKYPKTALAHQSRGLFFLEHGRSDLAYQDFQEALKIEPGYLLPYYSLGNMASAQGDYSAAINFYTKALEINPSYPEVLNNRGNMYLMLGQHQEAFRDYNQVLNLNPKHTSAYLNRGMSYYDLGEWMKALDDFTSALRLDPQDPTALEKIDELKRKLEIHSQK